MVEWGAPESDGGAPLEGYKVAVRDAKRHMWMEVGRVAADVQNLKVQELAEGNLYFLRIYAHLINILPQVKPAPNAANKIKSPFFNKLFSVASLIQIGIVPPVVLAKRSIFT